MKGLEYRYSIQPMLCRSGLSPDNGSVSAAKRLWLLMSWPCRRKKILPLLCLWTALVSEEVLKHHPQNVEQSEGGKSCSTGSIREASLPLWSIEAVGCCDFAFLRRNTSVFTLMTSKVMLEKEKHKIIASLLLYGIIITGGWSL